MIEYKVRPVTRFVVTRFEGEGIGSGGSSTVKGEFDNPDIAYQVAYALCKEEHERLGLPVGSMDIIYPNSMTP